MKYLSIQTFQCGISVSGAATFTGGASINLLSLNGATTSSEASLFLGAHGTNEGGQLVLQKGTSNTYAAHLDNYSDQFRVMYGTNTGSAGVALTVNLATRQLVLSGYTSTTSFTGTAVGYLAFDSSGNIITTASPAGAVTSIIAGTGVSVSSATGNVTISIGQSVATSAQVTFDSVITNNNGNGTNFRIGDDVWIGDVNVANTFRVTGAQSGADGYIIFGNANSNALGRSGTGNLTYAGSTVWTAATLTNLNQLTNGPGYITSASLSGYVPTSRTLTINGTSYDLSADRTWTINTVSYTSRLQHQVKAGVAINKGQAVYVTSADGTNMIVGLASNASEPTSSKTMGLLDATVAINGFANVVTEGLLAGLDTSTAGAEGDPVWLGTGGNLIYGLANKPSAPAHLVFIGIVTRKNNSNGEIFVKVQNGFELNEIHDVDLKTVVPVNGHILGYDGTLWVNKTIAGWLGYTPANASGTTNYLSKFTGSTTLGDSLVYDDGTNLGINTTTPTGRNGYGGQTALEIVNNTAYASINVNGGNIASPTYLTFGAQNSGADIRVNNKSLQITVNSIDALKIPTTGNILINTTTDAGYKLDVNGTARINSTLYITDPSYTGSGRLFQSGNSTLVLTGGPGGGSENITFGPSNRIFINAAQTRASTLFQISGGLSVGTFNYPGTYGAQAYISGSTTASSGAGRGVYVDSTIVAAANNDVLVGLDVNPTFTNGAFTGVQNVSLRVTSNTPIVRLDSSAVGSFHGIEFRNTGSIDAEIKQLPSSGEFRISNGRSVGWGGFITFYTDTVERVRIRNNGNVLIGTTTDAGYKLDVNGTAIVRGSTLNIGATYLGLSFTGSDCNIFNNGGSAGSVSFSMGGNKYLNIYQVSGSSSGYTSGTHNTFTTPITYGWSSGTATSNLFVLNPTINNTGTYSGIFRGFYYNPTLTSLTGTTHRGMEISSGDFIWGNGYSQYNTNAEEGFVQFQSSGNTTKIWIRPSSNQGGFNNNYWAYLENSGYTTTLKAGQYHDLSLAGESIRFKNQNLSEVARFTASTANFLIGTTTDSGYKLDVNGTGRFQDNLIFSSGKGIYASSGATSVFKGATNYFTHNRIASSGTIGFQIAVYDSVQSFWRYNDGTGDVEFGNANTSYHLGLYAGNVERVKILSNGNVGIGTTSPSYKLDVNGSFRSIGTADKISDFTFYRLNSANQIDIDSLESFILSKTDGSYGSGTKPSGSHNGFGVISLQTHSGDYYTQLGLDTNQNDLWIRSANGTTPYGAWVKMWNTDDFSTGNINNWNTAYGWGNHSSAGYATTTYVTTQINNLIAGAPGALDTLNELASALGNDASFATTVTNSLAAKVPTSRTLTINGTAYDLSADRSWTIATTTPGGSNTQFQYNNGGSLAGASALTYNSANNRIGVNQSSPGYDLDVNGQVRVQDKLRVGNVNSGNGVVHMSSSATINPSATTIVWSQSVSVGMCAFIDYYILNNNTGTDQRAGTIVVTWNQSGTPTIAHTETSTTDIGSTTAISFTSSLVGADARINAVNSSSAPYTMVMSFRYF